MKLNFQPISNVLGILISLFGGMMLLIGLYSLTTESNEEQALIISALISICFGLLAWRIKFPDNDKFYKREGYLIVVLSWFLMIIFGSLPYYLNGNVDNMIHALFESSSGLTTTGATIMTDIEALPDGILLWRSLTQWIGGMGIIVLTVALMPLLGIAGIELFVAEAPGPTADKVHPRIKETAKRLWFLYVGLTAVLCLILSLEGMTAFDAVNHALTTMATGGFSTKNASIAFYNNPLIEYTIAFFMLMAGTNYFVIYQLATGRLKKAWANDEYRWYLGIVLLFAVLVTIGILAASSQGIEQSFRESLFMCISVITTTGFVTADYTSWSYGLTAVFFVLLFAGGSAGSTSGGIKIIRHMIFVRNSILEFKRILHPRAMIRIKLNKEIVPPRILTHILVFFLVYVFTFIVGTAVVAFLGLDVFSAAGAVATSMGNVGPAVGSVGPVDNFYHLPDSVKAVLSFLMILGRLELFTVLIIFTPYFWKTT